MNFQKYRKHIFTIVLIFLFAGAINAASYIVSGINPKYNQSSDATVHLVDWQKMSADYSDNFQNDLMFQNYQVQPTGVLFTGKILVSISEFLRIDLLTWSIVISYISLAVFLSGVYALTLSATGSILLATIISLISSIPVISLGLSSWGFLATGFVPKEISLGIAVWLSLIYISGIRERSDFKIYVFFALCGLFSNWYPVLFFHYAAIILLAEILRQRAVKKEHLFYGILFLAASPVALYDIFIRSSGFTPPVTAIIIDHYADTLHSFKYLIIHYLRKQIIYIAMIIGLWYAFKRITNKDSLNTLSPWYAIWRSSLFLSLIGVGIEVFAPQYMKYLISRTSVWFYYSSMMLTGYMAYQIYFSKFSRTFWQKIIFSAALLAMLISQSSVLNVYDGIKDMRNDAKDYKDYLAVITNLKSLLPPGTVLLSNPDREAKTIRTYGGVGSYVSWKDGNVTLFDGDAAARWFQRYKEAQAAFSEKDFSVIENFGVEHDLKYYLFNEKDLVTGTQDLDKKTIFKSGHYGVAKLY